MISVPETGIFNVGFILIQYKRRVLFLLFQKRGEEKREKIRKVEKIYIYIYILSFSIHPSLISSCNYFSTKEISKGWSNDIKRLKLGVLPFCAAKLASNLACNDAEGCHFSLAYAQADNIFCTVQKNNCYWEVLLKPAVEASDVHVFVLRLLFHKEHFCNKHFSWCKLVFNPYVIALNLILLILVLKKHCLYFTQYGCFPWLLHLWIKLQINFYFLVTHFNFDLANAEGLE